VGSDGARADAATLSAMDESEVTALVEERESSLDRVRLDTGVTGQFVVGTPEVNYVGSDAATITWTGPPAALLGLPQASDIKGYTLRVEHSGQQMPPVEVAGPTALSARLEQLLPKTKYKVMVMTKLASGLAGSGPAITFVTRPSRPSQVGTPMVSNVKVASLLLSWHKPFDGGAPIKSYQITMQTGGGGGFSPVVENGVVLEDTGSTATSRSIQNLQPGHRYAFMVKATNSAGHSPSGTPSSRVDTLSASVPTAPGTAHISQISRDGMTLTWTPAHANGVKVVGYQLLLKRGSDSDFFPYNDLVPVRQLDRHGNSLSTRVTHMKPGTSTQWRLYAVNQLGTGPPGTPSILTSTLQDVPKPPEAPVVANITSGSAILSWTAPADQGQEITRYRILVQKGGQGGFLEMTQTGSETSYTAHGLAYGGVAYQFRVQALNLHGWSKPSPSSDTITTAYDAAKAAQKQILIANRAQKIGQVHNELEQAQWQLAKAGTAIANATAVAKGKVAEAAKAEYRAKQAMADKKAVELEFNKRIELEKLSAVRELGLERSFATSKLDAVRGDFVTQKKNLEQKEDLLRETIAKLKSSLTASQQKDDQKAEQIRQLRRLGCKRGMRDWCN